MLFRSSQTQIDDWSSFGWRGYSFSYGQYLWIDGDALRVNYYSEKELMLRQGLVLREMNSLNASLAGSWLPYGSMVSVEDSFIMRIDYIPILADNKTYTCADEFRLAIYSLKDDLRDMPQRVMTGRLSIEGSGCFQTFSFEDELGFKIDISEDYSDKDGFWHQMAMTTPEGKKVEFSAMECYWLDLLD